MSIRLEDPIQIACEPLDVRLVACFSLRGQREGLLEHLSSAERLLFASPQTLQSAGHEEIISKAPCVRVPVQSEQLSVGLPRYVLAGRTQLFEVCGVYQEPGLIPSLPEEAAASCHLPIDAQTVRLNEDHLYISADERILNLEHLRDGDIERIDENGECLLPKERLVDLKESYSRDSEASAAFSRRDWPPDRGTVYPKLGQSTAS